MVPAKRTVLRVDATVEVVDVEEGQVDLAGAGDGRRGTRRGHGQADEAGG
jgi:hypothetical protein